MPTWLYVIVCLAVPQVWALLFVRGVAVHERRAQRRARARAADERKDFVI